MYKTFYFIHSVNIQTILTTQLTKNLMKVKAKSSFYESLENMKDKNKDTVFVLVHVYSAVLTYLHSELNIVFKLPFSVGERTQLLQFMWHTFWIE